MDVEPRLIFRPTPHSGNRGDSIFSLQLISHQLVDPTHLIPRRYLPNSTPLLYISTLSTYTANTPHTPLLQGENLNRNPQAILTASPPKPRSIRMCLPLSIVQPSQHLHDSLDRHFIDLKLREGQRKSIERIQHPSQSYIGEKVPRTKLANISTSNISSISWPNSTGMLNSANTPEPTFTILFVNLSLPLK